MSNMSHCRFENTVSDFADCERALKHGEFQGLNETEQRACRCMYRLAKKFIETYEDDMTTPEYLVARQLPPITLTGERD